MSQNFSSPSPIQPFSIGNVVTAAVRLYRSNLKTYLRLASQAHLWILLPIYGWAKYFTISGLISRLAFGELINQPESIHHARSHVNPRMWSFLRVAFQVGISLLFIYIGLAIIGGILVGIIGFILSLGFGNSGITFIVIFLTTILVIGIILLGILWYYSHWVIAEVPLAVEVNINGGASIDRSWELTKNSKWRIQGIVVVSFVVTLPIIVMFSYLPQIFLASLERGSIAYTVVYFISFILSLIGGVFVMPFWQAMKAVIYYDLRTRREGMGLKLRDGNV
jgi:hypothetical protein